jgi:hypothetical protein
VASLGLQAGEEKKVSEEEKQLITKLESDFEELVKKDKEPQLMRDAAQFLEQTNQSDRWPDYLKALTIIRRTRSKAAIPLLMKSMVQHASFGNGPSNVLAYTNALSILTGKDFANPYRYAADRKTPVREAVADWVAKWWDKEKKNISTDLATMSKEQLQVVVDRLMKEGDAANARHSTRKEDTQEFAYLIDTILVPNKRGSMCKRRTNWMLTWSPTCLLRRDLRKILLKSPCNLTITASPFLQFLCWPLFAPTGARPI